MRLLTAALLILVAAPLSAQRVSGTYVVQRGGNEIGREAYTLESGRARDRSGTSLTVSSRYPGAMPSGNVSALLERTPDGQLSLFQLDVEGDNGTTTFLAAGAGARILLKTIAEGSEAGRELPGGENVVLIDENVYSLFTAVADLATPAGARLVAIYPRTGRRAQFSARREGDAGAAARISLTGEISGTLTTDAAGRITRMEFPSAGIVVSVAE
ncbi:MAG TPA: hypothetical protein VFT04_11650 [Gemmatimonadales bacterium]|nr:hypothetical protein [Gemmatimonadales bacterium]